MPAVRAFRRTADILYITSSTRMGCSQCLWSMNRGVDCVENAALSICGARQTNNHLTKQVLRFYCSLSALVSARRPRVLRRALGLPAEHSNCSNFSQGVQNNSLSAAG